MPLTPLGCYIIAALPDFIRDGAKAGGGLAEGKGLDVQTPLMLIGLEIQRVGESSQAVGRDRKRYRKQGKREPSVIAGLSTAEPLVCRRLMQCHDGQIPFCSIIWETEPSESKRQFV